IRTPKDLEQLKDAVKRARKEKKEYFDYPPLEKPLGVQEAEIMIPLLEGIINLKNKGDPPPVEPITSTRKGLVIKSNLETAEYTEGFLGSKRASRLAFDKTTEAGLELPAALRGELKAHQCIGVAWLQHLWYHSPAVYSGCVMADDMGLGKTLQLLTFIAWYLEKPEALPVLIVAPVSLLENWRNEIRKFFTPGFTRELTLYGKALAEKKLSRNAIDERLLEDGLTSFLADGWLGEAKLVLTTYETLRDLSISLGRHSWGIMVCDEAQKIKTPGTLVTDAAKAQRAAFKIACTGTPVENSLTDLWCLFDFVQPGLLGPLNRFSLTYRRPIENSNGGDQPNEALDKLRALIEPQLLRRTKREVAKDLPAKYDDKHEHIKQRNRIALNDYQRRLYREAIADYQMKRAVSRDSAPRSNPILTVLHRLRAICADPRPIGLQPDLRLSVEEYRRQSPKFNWLIERLNEVRDRNEKTLIFTEYLDLQRALQHYLRLSYGLSPRIINGSVRNSDEAAETRQKIIDRFQAGDGFDVLILSPKAAGFGLNIQAANHVIHYTRPWNPAVEDQATDRAYRIGQTRDVYVYYPTVQADDLLTFEEKLDELLRRKRDLAGDMLNGTPVVSQDEFGVLLPPVDPEPAGSDERVAAEHLPRIIGRPFEALCLELWIRQGYDCSLTRTTRDGGIDIVATKGNKGLLIQCKSSAADKGLGWDAIKEVVAGAAAYEQQFPAVLFNKVAVTNRVFNDTAIRQAQINEVEQIDAWVISEWLTRFPIPMKSVAVK
ncbi:MAG: SNF2-related protein, partial [Methylococcales bacterium]